MRHLPRRAALRTLGGALLAPLLGVSCRRGGGGGERVTLMVPASERRFWAPIAASFEAAHPGVGVELREGPNSTDLRENLYTAALLAKDDSLDLVYMDVTWTPKFAAVGWLVGLDRWFGEDAQKQFLPGALEAGRLGGTLYRIPLRTDIGLLYHRADWLAEAGLAPPRTFAELLRAARALGAPPARWGFVWQGSQYEGLVCDFLEVLRGHGGFWIDPATLAVGLDGPGADAALAFLRGCVADGVSPPGVTTYTEEESRRLFQDGRAVFLRNWAYVWGLAQRAGSRIAGRIGVGTMVHAAGAESAATLGGWGLGVSRFSRRRELAAEFVRHASSLESQRALCAPTGFAPARIDAYTDAALLEANPFLARLRELHASAVARPAIPRYAQASDILQRHLSAALAGLAPVGTALAAATRETRRLLGRARGAAEAAS